MARLKSTTCRTRNNSNDYVQAIISSHLIAFVSFFLLLSEGCVNRKEGADLDDIPEVRIGDQVWMARNFDGVIFRNGDSIPQIKSAEEWDLAGKSGKPAWCYYENDTSIGKKYGRIYNWYAVSDARGFSPIGWHVPTNNEWIKLENFLGIPQAGLRLKCTVEPGTGRTGNDSTKFCASLGGYRSKGGGFSGIEEFTYLASSTQRDRKVDDVWGRGIHISDSTVMRCGLYKGHGLYVRLIKD